MGWLEFLPQLEIKVFLHYEVEIEERRKLPVVVNKTLGSWLLVDCDGHWQLYEARSPGYNSC